MRRLLGVALVLGTLVTLASVAGAQESFLKTTQIPWVVNLAANSAPNVDSLTKTLSMVGSTAVPDTSKAIDTAPWAWGSPLPQIGSITTGALYAIGRVSVTSANTCVGNDTLFVAIDSSPDGTNWNSGAYIGYGQGTTGGADQCLTAPLVVGIGATTAGSVIPSALSRFIRLRIRPDGNQSAVFTAAKLYVSALNSRLSQ
jgi:hypothetical protein